MDTPTAQDQATPQEQEAAASQQEGIFELVERCVQGWKQEHGLGMDLKEQELMMARRVNSWIAPNSVVAGVVDIMAPVRSTRAGLSAGQIEQLGNQLASLLKERGLLAAQPRRGGMLG